MQINKISTFHGEINGVQFFNEQVFDVTLFILNEINSKFGEIYSYQFIEDISYCIAKNLTKFKEDMTSVKLYNNMLKFINKTEDFNDLNFDIYYFGLVNTRILDKYYLTKKEGVK